MTLDGPGSDHLPDPDTRTRRHTADRALLRDDAEFQTQLADVRARLLRDAGPAGVDGGAVQQAIDETVDGYETASVRSFLAVLIERDVRNRLRIRTSGDSAPV